MPRFFSGRWREVCVQICVIPRPSSQWPSQTTRGPTLKQTLTACPERMTTRCRWRTMTRGLHTWWTVESSVLLGCLSLTVVTCTESELLICLKHICPYCSTPFELLPTSRLTLPIIKKNEEKSASHLSQARERCQGGEESWLLMLNFLVANGHCHREKEVELVPTARLSDLTARIVAILFLTICFLKKDKLVTN